MHGFAHVCAANGAWDELAEPDSEQPAWPHPPLFRTGYFGWPIAAPPYSGHPHGAPPPLNLPYGQLPPMLVYSPAAGGYTPVHPPNFAPYHGAPRPAGPPAPGASQVYAGQEAVPDAAAAFYRGDGPPPPPTGGAAQ